MHTIREIVRASVADTSLQPQTFEVHFTEGKGLYRADKLKLFGSLLQDVSTQMVCHVSIDKTCFDLLLALIDGKMLDEAATVETLSDPLLYEKLCQCIKTLEYQDEKGLVALIEEQIRNLLPYKAAKAIAERCHAESSMRPFVFETAENEWLTAHAFTSENEAETYFADLRTYYHEMKICSLLFHKLKISSHESPASKYLGDAQMANLQSTLTNCSYRITHKMDVNALKDIPINKILRLTHYTEHPVQSLRELSLRACQVLATYNQRCITMLRYSRADMTQRHLLEYAVGPRAHLLAYYNFRAGEACFHYPDGEQMQTSSLMIPKDARYVYSLDNDSPWDLENEMRRDLASQNVKNLPPRLIAERIFTKTLSAETVLAKRTLLPIAEKGLQAPDTEKNQLLQQLIELNNWQEFLITPSNLHIESMDREKISGSLTLGDYTKAFLCSLETCRLLVPRRRSEVTFDSQTTRQVLADMKRAFDHKVAAQLEKQRSGALLCMTGTVDLDERDEIKYHSKYHSASVSDSSSIEFESEESSVSAPLHYPGRRGNFVGTGNHVLDGDLAKFYNSQNGSAIHQISFYCGRQRSLSIMFSKNSGFAKYLKSHDFSLTRHSLSPDSFTARIPEDMLRLLDIMVRENDFPQEEEAAIRREIEVAIRNNEYFPQRVYYV